MFDMVHDNGAPITINDAVDSRLVFSPVLAKQTLYPAIDPGRSGARLLDAQYVGAQHVAVAHEARELLARYAKLHDGVETNGLGGLGDKERTVAVRARRIQRFLTQPFVVAEPWTGQSGEQVTLADTLAGVTAILAGRYDDVSEDALRFVGVLPDTIA
jgi:F-type H+-transporting ATPase subunit beta